MKTSFSTKTIASLLASPILGKLITSWMRSAGYALQSHQNPHLGQSLLHIIMLLFMVRGMFSGLQFPYAHFATKGATADQLFPLVWEAVQQLEYCGFGVIAFCCDGASPNRAFYKMHGKRREFVYRTPNPFTDDRNIYFICDVPHLIKTTRNCWSNSFAHKHSRPLWVSLFFCKLSYKLS